MNKLVKLDEPLIQFDHGQATEDPRDGLTLFGPLSSRPPFGISYGAIGTIKGIERLTRWMKGIQGSITHKDEAKRNLWIPFPGFEAAFGIPISTNPIFRHPIAVDALLKALNESDPFQRVHRTVSLYIQPILEFYRNSDLSLDLWFIISPEELFKTCRPKSQALDPAIRVTRKTIKARQEKSRRITGGQGIIFEDYAGDYEAYKFDNDFRQQLKARLSLEGIRNPVQVIRETTLTPLDFLDSRNQPVRDLQPESQVAWNMLSAVFYKAGGKPWKLSGIRPGVCYLGMVFKKYETEDDSGSACCAAQMFLDSGDGVVFKGAVGPWYSAETRQFHLSREAAEDIVQKAMKAYEEIFGQGSYPKEIFIHGRTYYDENEWAGFMSGAGNETNVVGVRIRRGDLKLFRPGDYFSLRGMAYFETEKKGYLWPTGYIPRLRTSPFSGVPIPLEIEICKGEAEITTVVEDIFALTKLNYNSCNYGDGEPITLRFADMIGDILTATSIPKDVSPLPFKFYI
jgi:hypothetical protein